MDEIRRAAEAADRVDVLHVPGGGRRPIEREKSAKPAKKLSKEWFKRPRKS
jgi:hypothetical protein